MDTDTIFFALIFIGFTVLIIGALRRLIRPSPASARAQKAHVRGPVENPVAAIFVLGSDPSLHDQASQDLEIYKDIFPDAQAHSFVSMHQLLAELSSRPCHIAHVLNKFDASGRVVWEGGEGDVFEVLKAFSDTGSLFVFLASGSGGDRQELTKELFRSHDLLEKPRFVLATLIDRGPEFGEFLREFVEELRRGRPPVLAWLSVRPQDAGGPQPVVDRGPTGLLVT